MSFASTATSALELALLTEHERYLKDLETLLLAWQAHVNRSVKSARSQQSIIQALLLISCPNDENLQTDMLIMQHQLLN